MENLPFKPITAHAKDLIDRAISQNSIAEALNKKIICACLGCSEENRAATENYDYRCKCSKHIEESGHQSFFPEKVSVEEIRAYLTQIGMPQLNINALCEDKNILNEVLIINSDIIFIVDPCEGASIEFGKLIKTVPYKIRVLLPSIRCNGSTQLNADINSLELINPEALISYEDENDFYDKISRCLALEKRKHLYGALK